MAELDIFYKIGDRTLARGHNAIIVPRSGDFVVMDGLKFAIKEVLWHLDDNYSWIEIQVERA